MGRSYPFVVKVRIETNANHNLLPAAAFVACKCMTTRANIKPINPIIWSLYDVKAYKRKLKAYYPLHTVLLCLIPSENLPRLSAFLCTYHIHKGL